MEAEKWVVENNRLRLKGEENEDQNRGDRLHIEIFSNPGFPKKFNFS